MKIFHRVLLILLSVTLAFFSFEPFAFRFFALIAWIPFLLAIRDTSLRFAFRIGLFHSMLLFGGTLSWTLEIFSTFAPVLWFILSLFPALFAGLTTQISKKAQPLIIAILWTGLEYLRCELFWLHFPWITPGTAVPPGAFAPLIGVYGVSFLIILGGMLLIQSSVRTKVAGGLLLLSVITLPNFYSAEKNTLSIKVALIQNESLNYDNYRIATSEISEQVDVIVWPEYAIGFDPRHLKTTQLEVADLLGDNTQLLIAGGKTWFDKYGDRYSNTAFTFDREHILGTHTKNRLVHFFNEGKKGIEAKAIDTPLGKIGTPICFDCDHQDVIRRMTASGAESFFIPSMDAKHWTRRQHLQHGQLFRHRAAENARWLAIASTSGLTQVINSGGQTVKSLPLMEEGTLIGLIESSTQTTLFQKGGWLVGPLSLIGTIIITLAIVYSSCKRGINGKAQAQEF